MRLTLEHLQILDAIETQGSFSAAAAVLHRVPSALSHAVAKLEDDLGATLFLREGRRASLTEAGRILLEDGRHLLRAARELERRVQRVATGWEAQLRIAIDQILPAERIYPLLARFYAAGHATRIALSDEVLGGGWDALAAGRVDLVIGAPGDMPARSGMSSRLLSSIRLRFMVAPHHPLALEREALTAQVLRSHRAVVIADTSRELTARTAGLLEGQDTLRVPNMAAKAAAQAAGLGVGHLPDWLARQEVAAGRLVERVLADPRPPMPCYIAWHNRRVGNALAWFLAALAEPDELARLAEGLS